MQIQKDKFNGTVQKCTRILSILLPRQPTTVKTLVAEMWATPSSRVLTGALLQCCLCHSMANDLRERQVQAENSICISEVGKLRLVAGGGKGSA